jgi:hypothetical protein
MIGDVVILVMLVIAVTEEMPVMVVMVAMPVIRVMLVMLVMLVIVEENNYDKLRLNTTSDIKISLYGTPLFGKTMPAVEQKFESNKPGRHLFWQPIPAMISKHLQKVECHIFVFLISLVVFTWFHESIFPFSFFSFCYYLCWNILFYKNGFTSYSNISKSILYNS